MLVTRQTFDGIVQYIKEQPRWKCADTETTGLSPYKGDRIFSVIIACGTDAWYFNFNPYEEFGLKQDAWLGREHFEHLQRELFSDGEQNWYLHNAKFDLHHFSQCGIEIAGRVICTYAWGRLLHNDLPGYGLDALAERWLKANKSDAVKEYCEEHGLYTVELKGKRKKKNYQFGRVPLSVIQPYGETDVLLGWQLGEYIRAKLEWLDAEKRLPHQPPIMQVAWNETQLTKTLYAMEKRGVRLDKAYAERALAAENSRAADAKAKFLEMTGFELDANSPTCIAKAFKQLGVEAPIGKAGRILTNKSVLATIKHPVVDAIAAFRQADKRAVTYYANFLAMCDEAGFIHPDFHQGGTKTGRLSCRDPNLQNLNRPNEDTDPDQEDVFEVRRAFVPRDPEFCFFAPDYDQIEYRLMLIYADEKELINQVLAGVDVHTATANILGVSRFQAKTINFMLIYGGGIQKLAETLKIAFAAAKTAREDYFKRLPKICTFVERVRAKAAHQLSLFNWYGRRYTFANADMTYTTGPNWLIQGGCADVLKIALNRCHDFLLRESTAGSAIALNIHDEIVFELHKSELDLAPALVEIMENVYTGQSLKLTAGPSYSWRSLADKEDGYPVLPASA